MTPERIAAYWIARAMEDAGTPFDAAAPVARKAVEAISAAGLVIVTAARAAELLNQAEAQPQPDADLAEDFARWVDQGG